MFNVSIFKVKALCSVKLKSYNKKQREKLVLVALVKQYIETGKPVGSQSLQHSECSEISAATIRNYFTNLENEGFLVQEHASAGRVPTEKAYRFYAKAKKGMGCVSERAKREFADFQQNQSHEIAAFLQSSADTLSRLLKGAVFLSAPRFDQDFLVDIKLAFISALRGLAILISDFGVIKTEIISFEKPMTVTKLKSMEDYCRARLRRDDVPEETQESAKTLYNELLMRYAIGYSTFVEEEIYRTGFSHLLDFSDFRHAANLASSLALFENTHGMRLAMRECMKKTEPCVWIGEDLLAFAPETPPCSVIGVPYFVREKAVGGVGFLGPKRMPYEDILATMEAFSKCISETLTRNLYKFKIEYRQPNSPIVPLPLKTGFLLK